MAVGLVGDPVAGSVSPSMHRAAFEATGLGWTYDAVTVPSGALARSWPAIRERFDGLNVTIPHKEAVLPLLDRMSAVAARAGSVNTVRFRDGTADGESTDGPGFMAALARAGAPDARRVVILGTGGAARAVAAALSDAGADVHVAGRNAQSARRVADDLGVRIGPLDGPAIRSALTGADLLVNATPLGGTADPDGCPVPTDVPLDAATTVFDLVYRPRRTVLLERAASAGCPTIEGIEMLIEQGALSFEFWTGVGAPLAAMRATAHAAIDQPTAVGGGR